MYQWFPAKVWDFVTTSIDSLDLIKGSMLLTYLHILRSAQNCSVVSVRDRFEEDVTAKVQKLH